MTFPKRVILLRSEVQRETLLVLVRNLPLSDSKPLQVTVEEYKKPRKLDQNAAYWAGPLKDIAEQAYIEGHRYSPEVLHEYFKREFLPEDDDIESRDEVCANYRKWDYAPDGSRFLVGSTTHLTVKGFSVFMEQVHAFGGSLGVQFTAREK